MTTEAAGHPLVRSRAEANELERWLEADFSDVERRSLEGAFRTATRARIGLIITFTSFSLWVAVTDPWWWRRIALAVVLASILTLDWFTRRRVRLKGPDAYSIRVNITAMMVVHGVLIFATGGLLSPMLPVMLPAAFLAGLLSDDWGMRRLVMGVQLPTLALYFAFHLGAWLPSFVPLPLQEIGEVNTLRLGLVAVVTGAMVVALGVFGAKLRRDARRNLERLQAAQRAALSLHRQRADDLMTMSGEIAHELKNPLASVKGLTQLLSRNVAPEETKTSERLHVLGREVERMQSILEEFLNFSRPLTPLSRAPVDLESLCEEVASLHEGMAAQFDVELQVMVPAGLSVRGDARKIGQVLINLLQNALEVAPPHSTVAMRGVVEGDGVALLVRDHGPGLSDAVASSLFDPGVTTKAQGNGLGLTVARTIAEQHGGTLMLDNHRDGGCVARLFLPNQEAS